ncbi:T9SS type A sorting domain-containing protein [bacterium]|nr:T9SS type A sorting domain-containing protein [bacterium]
MKSLALSLQLLLLLTTQLSGIENLTVSIDRNAEVISSDNQAVCLSFELTGLETSEVIKDGETFGAYGIPGEGTTYDYGRPLLPAVSRFVVVPPTAGLELVVDADEPRRIRAGNPPALCTDEDLTSSVWGDLPENALYPPVIAQMSEPTIIRGIRLVKITTFPIQYDPVSNTYLCRDHIRPEIRFTDNSPTNPVEHLFQRTHSDHFLTYIEGLAINGDQVRRDQPEDVEPSYVGHYCIAINSNCLPYVIPFIEWRRKGGYKVDILSFGNNATNSGAIRNAIRDLYNEYLENETEPFELLLLVGDRSSYSYAGPVGWQLASPVGVPSYGGANHADYEYCLLEGNDLHLDVGLGRWWSGSRERLELAVGRTLRYEADPYMDDTDWFSAGGAFSQHWGNQVNSAWHITIHTTVRWGKEVLEYLGYEDVRFYEWYDWDRNGARIGPVITDWFNDGMSVMIGRAELYNWRSSFFGVNNSNVNPLFITISGHGEWACENMTRTGSGNNLIGPVSMTCGWGWSVIPAANAVWGEMVNHVLLKYIPMGLAYSAGLTAFELYIPNDAAYGNRQLYQMTKTDVLHFGDPGLQPWIGVPRVVEATFTQPLSPGSKLIHVHVVDAEDDEINIEGAQVTLYAPGEIPDDEDDYVAYDDFYMETKKSSAEGWVRFVIDWDTELVRGTTVYITVTGRGIKPFLGEVEVERPGTGIELGNWNVDEDEINPATTVELTITAANPGEEDVEDVIATVRSLSDWVEADDSNIVFGDIGSGEDAEGNRGIDLVISPACPDGASRPHTKPEILVTFISGDERWYSAFKLDVSAPNFEVKRVIGGDIIDVGANDLDIEIENIGSMNAPEITARLLTLDMGASVVNAESRYPSIRSGESATLDGDDFTVAGNGIVVPGSMNPMMMILTSGDGFVDTAYFDLQIREPIDNGPIGPDHYGYICFDDSDEEWDIRPIYDWIEINPNDDDWNYRGTDFNFSGSSDHNIGEAEVIELGFTTNFYGDPYDCITVGTNGFIAPGDQGEITNFCNWPLDRAMLGGCGMIAPFWDDLRLRSDQAGVYYYYNEDNGTFIVEWYMLEHRTGGDTYLTFQVILYDRDIWPPNNGDQNILFQYKSIENAIGDQTHDQAQTPFNNAYASVGISGPNGYGLSYTYKNEYPTGAARLQERRALLFTTSPDYKSGTLFGCVIDEATGQFIEGASVYTEHGFTSTSDENGYWEIFDALAEVPFDITASKSGYNDSTEYNLEVSEDGELEINFSLLHPEFDLSTNYIGIKIDPDRSELREFTMFNDGNGPLEWKMARKLPFGADVEPWEHRWSYPVSQTVEDARVEGVVYANDRFFVSGANIWERENGENMIYVLNHDGELINQFAQPCSSRYGMRGLAWDGELLWGSGADSVFGFTPDGELVKSFLGPYDTNSPITWDPDREVLWIAGRVSSDIVAFDTSGEEKEIDMIPRFGLRMYGFAYWKDDPDNCPLYIFHSPDNLHQMIYKINPDDPETTFVALLEPEEGGTPGGACATNHFDVYSWVFIGISNNSGDDRIDIWQLEAKRDWFQVTIDTDTGRVASVSGTVDAREVQDFELTFNSEQLPEVEFEGYLVFNHNAMNRVDTLTVLLDVIEQEPPSDFRLLSPRNADMLDANIDETRITFNWEPSMDYNYGDVVSYRIRFRIGSDSLMTIVDSTSLETDITDLAYLMNIPDEENFSLYWRVQAIAGEDTVDCEDIFVLFFVANSVDGTGIIPVEFGLQSIYPSPFNSMTSIRFGIEQPSNTNLRVYDLNGREVAVLYDGNATVGYHQVVWNGDLMPSGIYILKLQSGGRTETAKVTIIR